ncbi:MAG: putative binding protein component of iron transporter precursor [Ilumatobacteraceae bacterium]|nr:putative binding protein component of iron transporter precursor [Ilumatobacteraceae bacterium]
MHRKLRPIAAATIAIALLATAGCAESDGGSSGGGDAEGKVLHVYSGRHYDVEKAFQQYEDETGVKIEFLTGNDAELRERIAAEGEDTEADVYITVDAGNLANAAEDGLFQPMDSPTLEKVIPEQYRDPDDLWFGLALRARTIIYNTDALDEDEVPENYEDLADPEWKGRVCMRNSTNDYQQSLVASMIIQDGKEKTLETLKGWSRNAEIYANDTEMIQAMAAGACDVGIANHYYLARELEQDPDLPVDLIWANQETGGTHVNISGGGITKYAGNPELAQDFLEWLGTDGQSVLVDSNHEFPASTEATPEPLITEEFGLDFEAQPLDAKKIGQLNPEAVELMDEAGFG